MVANALNIYPPLPASSGGTGVSGTAAYPASGTVLTDVNEISSLTATQVTFSGGYLEVEGGLVLSSGSGTSVATAAKPVTATLATLLTAAGLTFTANTLYAFFVDLTTLGAATTLDNQRKVYTWTASNVVVKTSDPNTVDPRRYVFLDQIYVPTGAANWSTASAVPRPSRHHNPLTATAGYLQNYTTQISSAVAAQSLAHGLAGEPQIVQLFYYDGTNKNGENIGNALVNKNSTTLTVSTADLTFGSGQYVEVQAFYYPATPAVVGPSQAYASAFLTSNATTQLAHGQGSVGAIKGIAVIEYNAAPPGGQPNYRFIDASGLVTGFDATYIYLDWTGLSPSGTLQYQVIAGGTPLPYSLPKGTFDSITNAAGTGAPNFPYGATGITTGVNASPIVKSYAKQTIGTVGSANQLAGGHILSSKSWPSALAAANYAYFNLAANANDALGVNNLTVVGGSPTYGSAGILGGTTAVALNGTTDYVGSDSAFYKSVNGKSFAMGAWFYATGANWQASKALLSIGDNATDHVISVWMQSSTLSLRASSATSTWDIDLETTGPKITATGWHKIDVTYDTSTGNIVVYLDGDPALTATAATALRSATTTGFRIGSWAGLFWQGQVEEAYFVSGYLLQPDDIRKLKSSRLDHNLALSPTYQKWSANFYGNQTDEDGTATGWMVDKSDTNSLFADFSDRLSTDSVELFCENRQLSNTMAAGVNPFDNTYTSNPSALATGIAHGQSGVPELVAEGQTSAGGPWEPLSLTGQVNADATNIYGSLAAFFTAGYVAVRLVARNPAGASYVAVPNATTTLAGLVSTADQQLSGTKIMNLALPPTASSPSAGTTVGNSSNALQVMTPTANVTVTLDGTHRGGRVLTFVNLSSSFTITLQANDATTINVLQPSTNMRVLPTQDFPTTASQWFTNGGIVRPGVSAGLVSANGLPGYTAGAIAAGYVGEKVTGVLSTSVTLGGTAYGNTLSSTNLALTTGVWMVVLAANVEHTVNNNGYDRIRIQNTTDNVTVALGSAGMQNATGAFWTPITIVTYLLVSGNKTLSVQGYDPNTSASVIFNVVSGGIDSQNEFFAVRVA